MKSDVYFSRLKGADIKERVSALKRIIEAARPFSGYKKEEIIPVKITVGDSQCVYNISPELVKVVIAQLKENKARPFLFDTNVIYKGERQSAVDHLTLANRKGFGHSRVGAPFIIADGLLGQDGKEYEVESGHLKRVKLPSFVGMLDSLVILSHATGHILAGYAGAIKNVAMGIACRPTKQVQHSSLKPHVIEDKCTACGCCIKVCPVAAIACPTTSFRRALRNEKAFIDERLCIGCGECICACKFDAIFVNWKEDVLVFSERLVETAGIILSKFKNKFFINFAFDITKECDCISTKNEKIISRDLGVLASTDIVSIDKATSDLVNEGSDVFIKEQNRPEYHKMLEYAAKIGLGNIAYNLKLI